MEMVSKRPGMPGADDLLQQARRFTAAKNLSGATDLYRKVLEFGDNAEALLHLSNVEARAGHYRRGREYALRALPGALGKPVLVPSLMLCLRHFEESGAIRRCIEASPFLRGMADPQTLQVVSQQLSWMGDQEGSLEFIDLALRFAPQSLSMRVQRATAYMFLGRFDEAEADFQECLRRAPGHPQTQWTLAQLRKWSADNHHVDAIRKALKQPQLAELDQARLYNALHKELDDLGDHAGAWEALEATCRIRHAHRRYDSEENRRLFAGLKQMPVREFEATPAGFTPVFIVGMYRSGTTLLEQLMGGDPGVVNAGELHDFAGCMRTAVDHYFPDATDPIVVGRAGEVDFAEAGRQYLDGVRWRLQAHHTHITDKWPPNQVNVGFICQALPQAKVIHMVRDPVEVCFSNLRELFAHAAQYSYDQRELADYHNQYRDLMAHWHARFPGRILDVDYTDLTRDTEATMRKVAAFCGFPFTEKLLQPDTRNKSVATASAVQVRDKVVARDVPKWKPYEKHLQPLIGALH